MKKVFVLLFPVLMIAFGGSGPVSAAPGAAPISRAHRRISPTCCSRLRAVLAWIALNGPGMPLQ